MSSKNFPYLHGFSSVEQERLFQQARFAEHKIHQKINFSEVEKLLEVGCGVGAQTDILLRRYQEMHVTGIDLNDSQLEACKQHLDNKPMFKDRYDIKKMNAEKMTFKKATFDGAFLCWVLEHVPNPQNVLSELRRVLIPGSKVIVNEVMNHSFFLDPYSPHLWKYWQAFNDFQYENAGDPFVGAKLGNLLNSLGFREIKSTVVNWHLDNRHPDKRKQMIEFWKDLCLSASDTLLEAGVVDQETVDLAGQEMEGVSRNPNSVFMYSFMQVEAKVF